MIVTKHAEKRMKERHGLSRKSAHRMAARAWEHGVPYYKLAGRLRRYIDKLRFKSRNKKIIKTYGMFVYVFDEVGETLITVHHIDKRVNASSAAIKK